PQVPLLADRRPEACRLTWWTGKVSAPIGWPTARLISWIQTRPVACDSSSGSFPCPARRKESRDVGSRLVAKSHFRDGGANLPVCRGAQRGAAHHFGNDFWQSLYTRGSVRKKVVPTSSSLWSQTSPP